MATILKKHELKLLLDTRNILEEILETLEVAGDPRTVKALQEGLRDVKAGRVRSYREPMAQLRCMSTQS